MRNREHHPQTGIGLFFIILGIALLVATNDLLNLGNISSYFTWQTAMIFVGALLLVNLNFIGGILLIAGGVWFFMERQLCYYSFIYKDYLLAGGNNAAWSFFHNFFPFKRKKNIN